MQTKRPATYQDVLDAPENMVAELIDDELFLSPRPAFAHSLVTSYLGAELIPPFTHGRGGPGGWIILDEPELHLGKRVCVPDLAGWRRERMPTPPTDHKFTIAPAWICEVMSPSTEKFDRTKKLAVYARAGIQFAWLIHPGHRLLEVFELISGKWTLIGAFGDDDVVRAEPFEAIELTLATLWKDLPTRASEAGAALYAPY